MAFRTTLSGVLRVRRDSAGPDATFDRGIPVRAVKGATASSLAVIAPLE